MIADFFSKLLGGSPGSSTARALGKQMGASPTEQGGTYRIAGTWKSMRCQVVLDGKADAMTVTVRAGPQNTTWEIRWCKDESPALSFVSTAVALTPVDAQRMERLPMKVRLHVIEVVEAGRGSLRLEGGQYTLKVTSAGLARPNAAEQAAIRLDVMADFVAAASKAL